MAEEEHWGFSSDSDSGGGEPESDGDDGGAAAVAIVPVFPVASAASGPPKRKRGRPPGIVGSLAARQALARVLAEPGVDVNAIVAVPLARLLWLATRGRGCRLR